MADTLENGAGVLDLNALYGVEKPLKVLWGEHEYVLRRPQAMGPRDVVALEQMQTRAARLQGMDANALTEAQANDFEIVTMQIVQLLCPELMEAELPFVARVKIIVWYFAQVNPDTPEKKMTPQAETTSA